jgi:hypothetical protein
MFNAKTRILSRQSKLTGKINEMQLPLSGWQFMLGFMDMEDGESADKVFPQLNADEQYFIATGVTPDELRIFQLRNTLADAIGMLDELGRCAALPVERRKRIHAAVAQFRLIKDGPEMPQDFTF